MDLDMPIMNGLESIKKIREFTSFEDYTIVSLTANNQHSDKINCIKAGANYFMSKPLFYPQIIKMLTDIYGKQEH